jgi:hypothetical protein
MACLTLCRHLGGVAAAGPAQDHRELIPAIAIDLIDLAAGGLQRPRDGAQQVVAGLVPPLVIERLEVIKVQHEHAEHVAATDRSRQLLLQPTVILQAGESVGLRTQLDSMVGEGVLEGDRDLGREQLDEVELLRLEVGLAAQALRVSTPSTRSRVAARQDERRRLGHVWCDSQPRT